MTWYRRLDATSAGQWAVCVVWTGLTLMIGGLGGWTGWAVLFASIPLLVEARHR